MTSTVTSVGPSTTICIFAKPPRVGQVKTRLAAQLGPSRAAALAWAFLHDSWTGLRSLDWAERVVATTGEIDGLPDLDPALQLWNQGSGDLGARLERVLRRALEQTRYAVALGADTPGLPEKLLESARDALDAGADAVLGPSEDGGFYLLGLRSCPAGLLSALPWSSADTGAATLEQLRGHGLSVHELTPWFDVDRAEDLERLRGCIASGEVFAPETASLLAELD